MFISTILRNKNIFFSSSDKRSIIKAIYMLKSKNVKSPPPSQHYKLIQDNGLSKVNNKVFKS